MRSKIQRFAAEQVTDNLIWGATSYERSPERKAVYARGFRLILFLERLQENGAYRNSSDFLPKAFRLHRGIRIACFLIVSYRRVAATKHKLQTDDCQNSEIGEKAGDCGKSTTVFAHALA